MTEQEKREKVIKGLGSCVEYFASKVKGVMFDEWLEESRKAIALLKAQEPVEPVRDKDGVYHCGNCRTSCVGYEVEFTHRIQKIEAYCHICGRAVKWQ